MPAALAIDPEHAEANTNLGNIRLRAGHADEAVAHYRAALRRDPDDVQTLQNLGRVLAWRGDLAGAAARSSGPHSSPRATRASSATSMRCERRSKT